MVVIVGRPNVGKSAIFNRLAGRRIAIVHSESGVTRDRLMREVSWGEERFELIDTGGIDTMDGKNPADELAAGVRRQTDAALADAAVAILVTDVEAGLQPLDEEVAGLVRRSGTPAVVAANKADEPGRDSGAGDFDRLGFPVFPVSALHNRGFDALMAAVCAGLPEALNATVANPVKVAVVGRPNVGKSSYVNRLLGSERVIVSDRPGTTRDSIDIPFAVGSGPQARHYVLIDTAGLRAVSKVDSAVERFSHFRAERSVRDADVVALVLDAASGPTARDRQIADLVLEHRRGCVLLVNKWDLATSTQHEFRKTLEYGLPFMTYCPIAFVSSKTGYNIRRSVDLVDHVAAQIRTEIPTGVLNRTIHDACARVHAPGVRGKSLKVFYATQVRTHPVTIRLFVNDPERVSPAYATYLVRSLRQKFGLEGAPVTLQYSGRR